MFQMLHKHDPYVSNKTYVPNVPMSQITELSQLSQMSLNKLTNDVQTSLLLLFTIFLVILYVSCSEVENDLQIKSQDYQSEVYLVLI